MRSDVDIYPIVGDRTSCMRGCIMVKATPTLIRLHIEQGYLRTAKRLLERLEASSETITELNSLFERAVERRKKMIRIEVLRRLLNRVRMARIREVNL